MDYSYSLHYLHLKVMQVKVMDGNSIKQDCSTFVLDYSCITAQTVQLFLLLLYIIGLGMSVATTTLAVHIILPISRKGSEH